MGQFLIIMMALIMPLCSGFAKDATTIVAFGDSLMAGYGLVNQYSFPTQLQMALAKEGINAKVINAGISGDTTAGGRSRTSWVLEFKPDIVIVTLGGNDVLRGFPPHLIRQNLEAILKTFHDQEIKVLLTGMKAPHSLGAQYQSKFDAIYPELAKQYDATFYPFFLEKVYGIPSLNLEDGIHPNADGISMIVEDILPYLKNLLPSREAHLNK